MLSEGRQGTEYNQTQNLDSSMIELTQEDLIKVKKKHKSVHYDETEINRI